MSLSKPSVSCRIYFERVQNVNGTRAEIIARLKQLLNFIQVQQESLSDVKVIFCPIVSRAGTDVEAALSRFTPDKLAIMMVLHHTFDPHALVPNMSNYEKTNLLIVNLLFYEDKMLQLCPMNDEALSKTTNHLVQHYPQPSVSINQQEKQVNSVSLQSFDMSNPTQTRSQNLDLWIACTVNTATTLLQRKTEASRHSKIQFIIMKDCPLWIACIAVALYTADSSNTKITEILNNKHFPRWNVKNWRFWTVFTVDFLWAVMYEMGKRRLPLPQNFLKYFKRQWPFWSFYFACTLYKEVKKRKKLKCESADETKE